MSDGVVSERKALKVQEGAMARASKEAKTRTWVCLFVSFYLKTTQGLNTFKILACSNDLVNQELYKCPCHLSTQPLNVIRI